MARIVGEKKKNLFETLPNPDTESEDVAYFRDTQGRLHH